MEELNKAEERELVILRKALDLACEKGVFEDLDGCLGKNGRIRNSQDYSTRSVYGYFWDLAVSELRLF